MKAIFDWLKKLFGEQLLALILNHLLTQDNIIKFIDSILDLAEDLAKKTTTKIDDNALKKIREALNIPDND